MRTFTANLEDEVMDAAPPAHERFEERFLLGLDLDLVLEEHEHPGHVRTYPYPRASSAPPPERGQDD